MRYFLYYLLAINIIAFLTFALDKRKAVKGKWRTRESVLLGLSFIGGSIGALLSMKICHHKTHKPAFKYGVPLMLLVHIIAACYYVFCFK